MALADLLVRFDPAICRAHFLTQRWAPATAEVANQIAPLYEEVPLADPAAEDKFQCTIVFDGKACGDCFSTLAGLRIHQGHSKKTGHTIINILRALVITNKCPSCETTFPSKQQTMNHLEASWLQSRCIKGNTTQPHKELDCDLSLCPLCAQTFDSVHALQKHLRAHIPLTPSGNALKVVAARAVSHREACLRGAAPLSFRVRRVQSAPRAAKASLLPRKATATCAASTSAVTSNAVPLLRLVSLPWRPPRRLQHLMSAEGGATAAPPAEETKRPRTRRRQVWRHGAASGSSVTQAASGSASLRAGPLPEQVADRRTVYGTQARERLATDVGKQTAQ